jgi:hypothetical protein
MFIFNITASSLPTKITIFSHTFGKNYSKRSRMTLTRKIEEMSFRDETGNYLDVKVNEDYIEVSINDSKNDRIGLTLEDWKQLDKEIRRIFKDIKKN